jgi:hypothetical protein
MNSKTLPGQPRLPRSCLDLGTLSPTTSNDLDAMCAAAWHRHGVAALAVNDITDPWLRQAISNEAARRWGRRTGGHGDGR